MKSVIGQGNLLDIPLQYHLSIPDSMLLICTFDLHLHLTISTLDRV